MSKPISDDKISNKAIRPKEFDEGKKRALEKDLCWLRARKSEFVEVDCPACRSRLRKDAFSKFSFDFVECLDCATVYMNPRADAQTLAEFYGSSALYEFWNAYIFPASNAVRKEKIALPRVNRIAEIAARFSVPLDCLLEVGAGHGTFCEAAIESGLFGQVLAVEPGRALAQSCRESGITVIEKPIEEITSLPAEPSIVACFEVIEHLFSPEDFLRNCHRMLAKDGILVVTCPNMHGFDLQCLRELSDNTDAEHINLFNPQSLACLLERLNFSVLEWSTPGYLDAELVRDKVLAGEYSLESQPFLHSVLIERWQELGGKLQTFLRENNMSSHLWMIARKNA